MKKEIQLAAKQCILEGKTKQETYEALKDRFKIPPTKIAEIVEAMVTLKAKSKYSKLNWFLIILLSLVALIKIIGLYTSIREGQTNQVSFLQLINIVINLLLIWGLATYHPFVHRILIMGIILGLVHSLKEFVYSEFNALIFFCLLIDATIVILGFYLNSKLHPMYRIVKETYKDDRGEDKTRMVIKFKD
ncbi:MAG: hypothetical protein NZ529_01475 [Cytophagaceae bacterium]|nr:hypothetical protein [Cytophagaceae bacterium]MDW8455436.1 hypothetical protein [Cytophagaceae bacterium]